MHWFIPACAGNTAELPPPPVELTGSSPRVRGTQTRRRCLSSSMRFIPACAGNTGTRALDGPSPTVHPRVCGEHVRVSKVSKRARGSSPRVRGTLSLVRECLKRGRFIPACAGNTHQKLATAFLVAVHPRVCGEHTSAPVGFRGDDGSSPRVRGTPFRVFQM